ncbi:L,D-transpeptidase family protein [Pseudoprimorskyibacter insulae]|uniref:L,D-transpeptidase family protein n=1 Tax=Pseudoprimorskyibacter insulae TaxID=1695997 RepID=UPI001FE67B42|nr:L,D-transpeptidase family protein [Pseudoprimorskyibacter insulae]
MTATALAAFVPGAPVQAQVTAFKQAVAETAARHDGVADFYRERVFEPIWTGDDDASRARRAAFLRAMTTSHLHGLPERRFDPKAILAMMQGQKSSRDLGKLEVELSIAFADFASALQTGILEPKRIDDGLVRKVPRRSPAEHLRGLTTQDPDVFFRSLVPPSPEYSRLMKAKFRMERQLSTGGWGATVPASSLKPGNSGKAVVALRDRLVRMGYMGRSASAEYDGTLQAAVRQFQEDHGLEADGVAGASTIKEVNIGVEERLEQIMVAMERERWLNFPEGLGKRHVKVNLTDFKAWIIDDDKVTFETRAVVGMNQSDRRTPEFSDEMERMVINPSWYVPRSIIVNEYLPALRSNPNSVGHLEITDARGRVVNRGNGFSQYSAQSFPFAMRQPPGPKNALGLVKFLFPNKYNIYLHDTPAKSLFSREVRAYSHGCIRLHKPQEFAHAILAPQVSNPKEYFERILRTGAETPVELDQHVPVHLMYRTAYTDVKGVMQYRNDVYGRDAKIWRALSAEGVTVGAVQG